MDWYSVNSNKTYIINTYDDGNEKYKSYTNLWTIIATNKRGKVQVMNDTNTNVIINSISEWKLTPF